VALMGADRSERKLRVVLEVHLRLNRRSTRA
jgi:hypothetical protein